jgi:hypothetical protein
METALPFPGEAEGFSEIPIDTRGRILAEKSIR